MHKSFIRRIIFLLTAVVIISCGSTVYAETVDSGICGVTLDWEFTKDGTLIITGHGEMLNDEIPWAEYLDRIKNVVLPEGLTTISNGAFCGSNITTIDIPDSVKYIGVSAFARSKLVEIEIPDTVETIENSLFKDCYYLEKVTLGKNICLFKFSMFENCRKLKEIYYTSETYPRFQASSISNVNAIIYYPEDCQQWKQYAFTDYTYAENIGSVLFLEEGTSLDFSDESYSYTFSPENNPYDGFAKRPEVIIKNKSGVLPKFFYSVTYGDNLYPGIATVLIEAENNHFSGLLRKNFEISKGINPVKTQMANDRVSLCEGKEYELTIQKGIGDISFTTENEAIATIDENGRIKGVSAGSTNIIITASGNNYYNEGQLIMSVTVNAHFPVIDLSVEPLCEKTGLTEGSHCARCNQVFKAQEILPALEHNYQPNVTAASCEDEGYTTYACICGADYISEQVSALGHNYIGKITKSPTCETTGVMTYMCQNDTSHIYTTILPATGHTEVNIPAKEATCKEAGLTVGMWCTECERFTLPQTEIPKLTTHSYAAGTVTTQPTCKAEGVKTYTCTVCNDTKTEPVAKLTTHTYSADNKCTVCGDAKPGTDGSIGGSIETTPTPNVHVHTEVDLPVVAPTCTTPGKTAGKFCTGCQAATIPQTDVPALGHTESETVTKATAVKNGKKVTLCTACGEVVSTETIAKVVVTLSKTNAAYTGKSIQAPTIRVKDANGNVLFKGTDYTVNTIKKIKSVGVYTYTIKLKGDKYSGSIKVTFTVKPVKVKLKSAKAGKKSVTVKWAKGKKAQVTGYEVMVATNKKFTKGKKVATVKGYSKATTTIKKLTSKKTYYIQIRAYKTVKVNGKSTKVYSNWSNVKTVRVN